MQLLIAVSSFVYDVEKLMFATNHKVKERPHGGEEKVLKPQAEIRLTKTTVKKEKSLRKKTTSIGEGRRTSGY